MRVIETNIEIGAPAERVWDTLMDFASFPEWNPFVTSIEGEAVVDESLSVQLTLPSGKVMSFDPTVTAVEPNRFFQWLGKVGIKGIFDGRHSFRINPTEHGCRFEHSERFTGLLSWMMGSTMRSQTAEGFESMNRALKERCEAGA